MDENESGNKPPEEMSRELAGYRQQVEELREQYAALMEINKQLQWEIGKQKNTYDSLEETVRLIERAKQEWETVVDTLPQLICLLDGKMRILRANRTVERWGLARVVEVKGREIHGLLHPDCDDPNCYLQTSIRRAWEKLVGGRPVEHEIEDKVLKRHLLIQIQPIPAREELGRSTVTSFAAVIIHDNTARKRAEEALYRRTSEMALLNLVGQMFVSTLEIDQVLTTVLKEIRNILRVHSCTVWLTDPDSGGLVCRQAIGPGSEALRGRQLPPGEGIAGCAASKGQTLNVPDVREDERYLEETESETGFEVRSILSAPLLVKERVIGVLNVMDEKTNRFDQDDETLMESISMTAAIAIENARLYERARQDAETRSTLLKEVNHRVKNNLTAIMGLLHAERQLASARNQHNCLSIIDEVTGRIRGLNTAHSMLSASRWQPLLLSDLAGQIINAALQVLPPNKRVRVEISPSQVTVTADQAHDLALIINELAANSTKYALGERDTAHISVRIDRDGDSVLCEFRDDGPGYPEEVLERTRECLGLGIELITNIVHSRMRGEVSLCNDGGAVTLLRFKAGNAEGV